jgi:hypothetical protein
MQFYGLFLFWLYHLLFVHVAGAVFACLGDGMLSCRGLFEPSIGMEFVSLLLLSIALQLLEYSM